MEAYQKIGGAILFTLILGCGVVSTISLLLLTTNINLCYTADTRQTSVLTYLLISLGALEVVNWLKHLIMSCQKYDQCWPVGQVLVWLLVSSCLSTVGVSALLFYILPRTDLLRGLALLMSFGLLPILLKTFILHNFKPDKTYYKPLFVCCLGLQIVALCFAMLHDFTIIYSGSENLPSHRPPLTWTLPTVESVTVLLAVLLVPFQWIALYFETDISVLTKRFALVSFRKQVNRCRHKFGLILPLWKGLWMVVCLYLFIPSYLNTHLVCSSQVASETGVRESQIAETKTNLEQLLLNDEKLNTRTKPVSAEEKVGWRYRLDTNRDPTWIPPQNVEEATMVKTDKLMDMLDDYISCTHPESKKCEDLRSGVDAIILPGRYSKQTISSYMALVNYVDGGPVEVSEPENVVKNSTYRAITIAFVCNSIIAIISAKAACQWESVRISYVMSASVIVPLSLVLTMLLCSYPVESLSAILKCAEPWSISSLVLVFLCSAWSIGQILFLAHGYRTGLHSLNLSADLSTPLTSSALVFGVSVTKDAVTASQSYRTYKFSYIKSDKAEATKSADGDSSNR